MADTDTQLEEGLERLEHIEENLEEIKKTVPGRWVSFRNGIWQGAGTVVGGILAIILLGWVLSLFGLIPGFGDIAHRVQEAMSQFRR